MRSFSFLAAFLCICACNSLVFGEDLAFTDDGARITISDKGQPVLGYVYHAETPAQGDGVSKAPVLSNYFHPIYGLYGEVVTGEAPSNWSGAPGISWGWTRMGVAGHVVNLTDETGGKRVFERIAFAAPTGDSLAIGIQNVWLTEPDGRAQVLENISFMVGKVDQTQRSIDLDVVLRSVSTATIYLEGSIPGAGLAFQLSPDRKNWAVTGALGELTPQTASYLSPWIVCSYRDDRRSTRSGLAVLQDSRNPGFAQPNWLIAAPDRFTAGVPEVVKAELKPGQALEFRYRFILYHLGGSKVDMTAEYSKFMEEGQRRE